jgi:hypothetical protein
MQSVVGLRTGEGAKEERGLTWVSNLACRIAAYVTAACVAGPYVYHAARGSRALLGLLEDDYYYYAIIADKLVTSGKLTFDGTTLTNGFHPLWMGVICLLRIVCGRFGGPYYVGLALVFFAAMLAAYELCRRFARALGAGPALAPAIAVAYGLSIDRLFTMGMEVTLAAPLLLWFFVEALSDRPLTPRRAAKLGAIASLAILARLDVAIAVALLVGAWLLCARPALATLRRVLPPFCAAGILVPLYGVVNLLAFGSVLPVSALAKRLTTRPGFDLTYVSTVAFRSVFGPTAGVLLPLGVLGLALAVRRGPAARPAAHVVGGVALAFAFIFIALNAMPGWTLFGWYAYPLVPATVAALVFVCEALAQAVRDPRLQAVGAGVVVLTAPARALRYFQHHGPSWSLSDNALVASSADLADRVRDRNGVYSMGAIAGVATYMMDKPVVQLEGLVADRAMVEHVRRQDPLEQVLRDYGVDYLVVSLAYEELTKHDGCYLVTQPNPKWAGPRVATMRGEICSEPVEHFFTPAGGNSWSVFPRIETLVFDVRHSQWRQPS